MAYTAQINKDFDAKFHECRRGDIAESREFYERFFARYPAAGKYWSLYAEHEFSAAANAAGPPNRSGGGGGGMPDFSRVEQIMKRALLVCPSFDLWSFYVKYVSRTSRAKAAAAAVAAGAARRGWW